LHIGSGSDPVGGIRKRSGCGYYIHLTEANFTFYVLFLSYFLLLLKNPDPLNIVKPVSVSGHYWIGISDPFRFDRIRNTKYNLCNYWANTFILVTH